MSGWEDIADAAAAEFKARGSLGGTAGSAYFAAVQAGWRGHMQLWVQEVYRRAGGKVERAGSKTQRVKKQLESTPLGPPPFNPFEEDA
jgi:hypothetical protein